MATTQRNAMAALFLALLCAIASMVTPAEAVAGDERGSFRDWKGRWTVMLKGMSQVEPEEDLAYTLQRRASRRNTITLENPVPTHQSRDVEVEWFFTYLSDGNSVGQVTRILDSWNRVWLRSLRDHGVDNVVFIHTPVGHIDGLEGGWNAHRERHQEIMLAFGDPHGYELPGAVVHGKLLDYVANGETFLALRTRKEAERFIKRFKNYRGGDLLEDYREAVRGTELAAAMKANDDRLSHILDQAAARYPKTKLSPHDPVFLVNGKYLVTGSNLGSVEAVYQTTNWLINEELGERWTMDDAKRAHRTIAQIDARNQPSTRFPNAKEARPERAITLEPPIPTGGDQRSVEVFYSYDTVIARRIASRVVGWLHGLPDGIAKIDSPVGSARVSGAETARRHQAMIMAGRPVIWEGTIETNLREAMRILAGGKRIDSETDLDAFLADINMPRSDYDAGLSRPETQARLEGVNERFARVRTAAGGMKHAHPVILIDGRHLIVGHRFRTLTEAFHTANALVMRELEIAKQ